MAVITGFLTYTAAALPLAILLGYVAGRGRTSRAR
jgi:hypothetical protein